MVDRIKLLGWRRIANAIWSAPNDPQIYGALEVDATNLQHFLDGCRAIGHRVTPTHLVGRAVALVLRDVPEMNVRLRGAWAEPRETADVFFITAVEGGKDLSGVKIREVDQKSVVEVAAELTERAGRANAGNDADLAKSKKTMDALPMPVLRRAIRFSAWLAGDLNKGIRALGVAREPFGGAAITSVGMFGLPMGFAPLSWMYRVPILVLVGALVEKPVAVEGRVEVRRVLPLTATIDHRYVDGSHIARAMKTFRAYLESPASFEREIADRIAQKIASHPS